MKKLKKYIELVILAFIQVILILLRYFNIVNWKWTYVLMPLWIFLAGFLTILILSLIESGYNK